MHHHGRLARAAFLISIALGVSAAGSARAAEVSFADSFSVSGTIEETGSMSESASPDWWVNSGGRLLRGEIGGTIQGDLPATDRWARAYAASSPVDTDGGLHPQNLFRLVTRRTWTNVQQTVWFRVRRTVMSASTNRNGSNGVLFFHRYLDGNNLYYAGLRVDGLAIVKKKQAGTYTTLGSAKVYPGTWDRTTNPNLLPLDRWIGLRTVIRTQSTGGMRLTLEFSDPALGPDWRPALDVVDSAAPITAAGFAGIRTDFMDVEFEDYEAAPWGSAPTPTPTSVPTQTAVPTPTRTPTPVATAPVPTATPPLVTTPTPTSTATPPSLSTPTPTRTAPAPTPTPTSRRRKASPRLRSR